MTVTYEQVDAHVNAVQLQECGDGEWSGNVPKFATVDAFDVTVRQVRGDAFMAYSNDGCDGMGAQVHSAVFALLTNKLYGFRTSNIVFV